ncbi:MAG: hypothetical protein GX654_12600 [Desulfatiglans sp.]|nr:hypothetical protein [Desulfatiglans sp.]
MTKTQDKKILNRYFRAVYNKLEADALLFNRILPHEGLKGSENENALADVIREFLPTQYGVESNVLIIDRNGVTSRQSDIVIYDNRLPRYFRKVYPIEMVYAVIEVKTQFTKQQVNIALENEKDFRRLAYYPLLVPFWESRTKKDQIVHLPPIHCIFGYRSETSNFSTFLKWFSTLPSTSDKKFAPIYLHHNPFIVCSLDKGLIVCRGDNVQRWLSIATDEGYGNNFTATTDENNMTIEVDPAKALFLFLETLWSMLENSPRHPGFDIRSYMDLDLGALVSFNVEGKIEEK